MIINTLPYWLTSFLRRNVFYYIRRFFYGLWDTVPDILLICGCTALFVLIWAKYFFK